MNRTALPTNTVAVLAPTAQLPQADIEGEDAPADTENENSELISSLLSSPFETADR